MSTPNGYILVKSSEFVPPTPSVRVSAPAKESKEQIEDSKDERRPIQYSGLNLQMGSRRLAIGKSLSIELPPQLDATQGFRKRFRYIAQGTSGTNQSLVTVGTAMLSFGSMATTTGELSSIISSFKIHSITIYPASGAANTYLEWVDSTGYGEHMKDERKLRPVPTGITVSSPIQYKPPSGSDAAWWQDSLGTSRSLFAILATAGCIIDVDASVTMLNVGTNVQQTGFTSLTVGLVYYPPLDGRATNRIAPVGRTSAV